MIYYVNGKYIDSSKANISIGDAGFLYGDGLFETMRFDNRKIFSSLKHIKRLQKGLEIVNLEINKEPAYLPGVPLSGIDKSLKFEFRPNC